MAPGPPPYAFPATRSLKPRIVGKGNGRRGRTVFAPHHSKAEPDRVSYYHHAAVNPRFRRIDGQWYCQLAVDYCFTHDGKGESSFADSLLAGIKRLDRHPTVLGWTRMWESYLQADLLTLLAITDGRAGSCSQGKFEAGEVAGFVVGPGVGR
jgi:hypothetical protein